MTNSRLLDIKIKELGFTISGIAMELKLSRQGFWKKMYNHSEFKQSEIEKISNLLNLDFETQKRIFFCYQS